MTTLVYVGPGGTRCLLVRKRTADGGSVVLRVETPTGEQTDVPPDRIVPPTGLTALRMVRTWAESHAAYPGFTTPDRDGVLLADEYCAQRPHGLQVRSPAGS